MQSSKQPDFSFCMADICKVIEYSMANSIRCIIPYTLYSSWPSGLLPLLEKNGLLRKEKSKKLVDMHCCCANGLLIEVEYTPNKQPFIQCMDCGNIRNVLLQELEYYESSPLHIAKFFTNCIDDIDKPATIIKDKAFFVGETNGSVLVYLVCGLQSGNKKEMLDKCGDHAQGAAFIILSSFEPIISKSYNMVSIHERKLYTLIDNNQLLNIFFIESHFAKNSQKQEAANIKWRNDPKRKAEDKLIKYLEANITNWNRLHHVEIADNICKSNLDILGYKTKGNKQEYLSKNKVKSTIKKLFESRNETHRILGHKHYNSDTYIG